MCQEGGNFFYSKLYVLIVRMAMNLIMYMNTDHTEEDNAEWVFLVDVYESKKDDVNSRRGRLCRRR